MSNPIAHLRGAIARRSEYNRIVSELRAMPHETAIDLGIFKSDARRIARNAVYGR